jgi:hypothetical protein
MFIDQNETVNVRIYYKKAKSGYTAAIESSFKELKEEEKKNYAVLNVTMKQMPWGLSNELLEAAIIRGINNERIFNNKLYKENKIKNLIVGWDAKKKNAKGEIEPVPANMENILKLSPDIAEAILGSYDLACMESEETEDNKELDLTKK